MASSPGVRSFARGRHEDDLPRQLAAAVGARDVAARESALAGAYTQLARRHNEARITERVDPAIRSYHERPARVLMADRFADPALRDLPLVGAADQAVDSVDLLSAPQRWRRLARLYAGSGSSAAAGWVAGSCSPETPTSAGFTKVL